MTVKDADIAICATFTLLKPLADSLKESNIMVGAQDVFWEEKGAFTGEVAPNQLKDAGCACVVIGHSERRQFFGETDETVNKKTKAALKAGLLPIVAVGELLAQRENGTTFSVIEAQLHGGLAGLTADDAKSITIAYEPVWAIGTGKTASPAQAQEVHAFIRGELRKLFGAVAEEMRIQYGGSVKPDNVDELMAQPDIDGALVGGAALEAESFARIVKFTRK
jgi:triosephosphate isomerase (TIM)